MARTYILLACLLALPLSATTRKRFDFKQTPQGVLGMDVFFPADWKASDRRPGIVFFFGGGFRNGTTRQFFTKAQYLASRGMVAASAEYRISSKHQTTPRESMEDCRNAIMWMREHAAELGLDPQRLAAGGGSAGATCAANAALSEWAESKPAALVLFNPPMELPGDWAPLSPNRAFREHVVPSILFFGTADPFLKPAREFFEKAAAKNRVELYLARDQKHGFFNDAPGGDFSWHASTLYKTDVFLRSLGYLQGKPELALPAMSKAVLFEAPAVNPPPEKPARDLPNVRTIRDTVYAKVAERELKLDLYLPQAGGKRPLLVWVHGGAWRAGAKERIPILGFLERGFAIASIGYRLSQEAAFPAQIHDCKAAIRWLRAHAGEYGYDADRIGVWGSSAGGHLVAMLGTSGDAADLEGTVGLTGVSSKVQAVVDYYGPTQVGRMLYFPSAMDHAAPDSPENQLLGAIAQANPEIAARANPASFASKADPPFFIVHGDADQLVPLEQSELLHDALKKAGAESTLTVLPGARHGGDAFQTKELYDTIETFLKRSLSGKS